MGVGSQRQTLAALHLGKRSGTNFKKPCICPKTGLDECEKRRPHWESISGLFSP